LVDVARVQRILERHSTFAERVFTPGEITYCQRQATPAECYAARWAAREACRKALGGIQNMKWHEIRVERAPSGKPSLRLEGSSLERMRSIGATEVMLALTHERRMAAAFCIAVRTDPPMADRTGER
jgi:holo-[acyl-carrier protein] synthase